MALTWAHTVALAVENHPPPSTFVGILIVMVFRSEDISAIISCVSDSAVAPARASILSDFSNTDATLPFTFVSID